MGKFQIRFNGRTYWITQSAIAQIQQTYNDWLDAQANGYEPGRHIPVVVAVQTAGVPVRNFKEASQVAAEVC